MENNTCVCLSCIIKLLNYELSPKHERGGSLQTTLLSETRGSIFETTKYTFRCFENSVVEMR